MSRTVRVDLVAQVDKYVAGMNKAGDATDNLSKSVADVADALRVMNENAAAKAVADEARRAANESHAAAAKISSGMLAMGAASVAFTGMAVKGFADFDAQMSAVKATGADAATNIDALRQAAMEAGRTFGQFSATDAAQGIEQLAKAGLSAEQILSGGLNGALSLAAAGEMAVGDAAEVTAKTLKQFALDGSQASHVADLLAAGAGKAVGDVSDLGMALAQSGMVAAQYGVSVEETVGVLSMFADNALLGSDAGTSLKTTLLMLADPTKEAQAALDEYNITAYDAQGNFVGMEALAGQLQDKLSGLSQAQQNAALKTIFGADAIRAATILMKEGADGVRAYVEAVNEQGYAAQVAATRMDNLKGDLAALSGSWETLTISMGSGANSPLRAAVQDLTGLVDSLATMPPAMQQAALAGAGLVAGLGLVGGGFLKTITAVGEARAAYKTLATDMPKTAAVMRNTAIAAGVLTTALVALNAIDSEFIDTRQVSGLSAATAGMLAVAKASDGTTKGVRQANIELDKFFLNERGESVVQGVQGLEGAFQRLNPELKTTGQRFNDFAERGLGAVTGLSTVTERLTEGFSQMDRALAGMASNGALDQAAAGFAKVAEAAKRQGTSTEQLIALFPEYHAQLQQQANALAAQVQGFDASKLSAQDYADWMSGKVPPALRAAADAAKSGGKDLGVLGGALDSAGDKAGKTLEQFLALANGMLQLSGSRMGLEAAIDSATDALKDNGRTLDINTEAGRANQGALDGIAAAALKLAESQRQTDASTAEMTASAQRARDAFVATAQQMGMTKTQAEQLANSYGLIPSKVATDVSAPGATTSKSNVDLLMQSIKALPASKQTQVLTELKRGGIDAAYYELNRIDGKTATTYVRTVYESIVKSNPGMKSVPSMPGWNNYGSKMQADGGILEFYGNGGMREHHIAQIARAGTWRVWAEDETGGEAYIPLALSKRARSTAILDEVARRFGYSLLKNANGNVWSQQPMRTAPVVRMPAPTAAAPVQTGSTFAPVVHAYGADSREVAAHVVSAISHQARVAAPTLPGGRL